VGGARPMPLMAVGSRFRRGTGSHGWGLKGGVSISGRGEDGREVAARM
jgi:hypothetical protein